MDDRERTYRSGEICIDAGCYRFKCYSDGSGEPPPAEEQCEIWLTIGDVFPAMHSGADSVATCLWVKVGMQGFQDLAPEARLMCGDTGIDSNRGWRVRRAI